MINKIKEYFEQISNDYDYLFKHKILIGYLSYGIGIIFQLCILFSILGFTGLSYLSISYSIILFLILAFLFIISIPGLIIFIIGIFLISVNHVWGFGISGKIILFLYIIGIISLPFILNKCCPTKIQMLKTKYKNKVINFYIKGTLIMFLIIFSAFIYGTFTFKVAYIETIHKTEEGKIFGKYLFYNKDYHFLDICGKNIVIPGNQVKSIEIKTTRYEMASMKNEDKNKLNKEYQYYCDHVINKKEATD